MIGITELLVTVLMVFIIAAVVYAHISWLVMALWFTYERHAADRKARLPYENR
jgi:hypothetical protein